MLAIVISEKGGTERREVFEKDEIHVGRVQGNDVLLPKGNVSKRHARLTFREGRVIVTDLKSTNGTYVNGHRIAQATIVREGDKIYVGDFVLRLDGAGAGPGAGPAAPTPTQPRTTSNPDMPRDSLASFSEAEHTLSRQVGLPLGIDPSPAGMATMPPGDPTPRPALAPRPPLASAPAAFPQRDAYDSGHGIGASTGPTSVPSSHGSRGGAAYREVLAALVGRVDEMIDWGPLDDGRVLDEGLASRIDRALHEQVEQLRAGGDLPAGIDFESLARDAHEELCGLGPLAALLDDEDVSEIQLNRFDRIIVTRNAESRATEVAFSCDATVRRTLARLCRQSGSPLLAGEAVVARSWGQGLTLRAVLPPAATRGCALTVRRSRTVETTLDELVRAGMLSRTMAVFLTNAAAARANILITAGPGAAGSSLLTALASTGPREGATVGVYAPGESPITASGALVLDLPDWGARGAELVRAAAALRPDQWLLAPMAGEVGATTLGVALAGGASMVALVHAPSLRQALDRLAPDLAAARPGMSVEAARSWMASSFDVFVELARLRDGRHRILRVSEAGGSDEDGWAVRDIFTFSVERMAAGGAVEGAFAATGVVPRLVEDLGLRGYPVDTGLFRRTTR